MNDEVSEMDAPYRRILVDMAGDFTTAEYRQDGLVAWPSTPEEVREWMREEVRMRMLGKPVQSGPREDPLVVATRYLAKLDREKTIEDIHRFLKAIEP